jgi:hypothetical protein
MLITIIFFMLLAWNDDINLYFTVSVTPKPPLMSVVRVYKWFAEKYPSLTVHNINITTALGQNPDLRGTT